MHVFIFFLALFAALFYKNHAQPLAPLLEPKSGHPIRDQYIIVLHASTMGIQGTQEVMKVWLVEKIASRPNAGILHHYESIHAFAVRVETDLLEDIRKRAEVNFVERDTLVHVWDHVIKTRTHPWTSLKNIFKIHERLDTLIQTNAPWGLSRISRQKKRTRFTANSYVYPKNAGQGVDVYIIDTGIYVKHQEFEGRARWGVTIPKNDFNIDANGHGTHCAGIIAGKTFGVAKRANVVAVKVLRSNGFGTNSDVIKGVEWVIHQHMQDRLKKKSIINMSLGGSESFALDLIVKHAIKLGIPVTVAAGNDFEDACSYSPACVTDAVTVGAMDQMDSMAFFSNFGKCVDLFAPGVAVLSAWIGSPNAVQLLSGTSMATPHVAGVMALYMAESDLTPQELKKLVLNDGILGVLKGIPVNTPNNLLSILSLLRKQNSK